MPDPRSSITLAAIMLIHERYELDYHNYVRTLQARASSR